MNETVSRWKARLGSLKWFAAFVLLVVLLVGVPPLMLEINQYSTALRNSGENQPVPIEATGALKAAACWGAGTALVVTLCIASFFCPKTVFTPQPVGSTIMRTSADGKANARATGQFLHLKRVQPNVEVSTGSASFTDAVANIVPLAQGHLMIYIHQITKTKLYGVITLARRESDWAAFVTADRVVDIEPGRLYGWRDRWAVRFRYRGHSEEPETLILSFDDATAQVNLVGLLRKMGFTVGTGMVT
jgi:hypothetical protein